MCADVDTILEIESRGRKGARAGSKADREEEEGEGKVGLAWRNVTQLSAVIGSSLVQ